MKYRSWRHAAENVGLIYMLFEKLFLCLRFSTVHIREILGYCIQKADGNKPIVKFAPVWTDIYALLFFIIFGVVIPIVFHMAKIDWKWFGCLGIYLIVFVLQSEINVVLFDEFRTNHMFPPKKGGRLGPICEWIESKWAWKIYPEDKRATGRKVNRYKQISFRRRIIILIMDYWLLFIGFSIVYWFFTPNDVNICLKSYGESIYFSIVTGTTLGYGEISPGRGKMLLQSICALQTLITLLYAMIVIANIVGLLPKAESMENPKLKSHSNRTPKLYRGKNRYHKMRK